MYPSEQRISHVAAGLWRHLYQCQHELERYGANDLKITLPALFAMYHCAAGTVMQLGEEELADLRREFEDNVANLAEEDYVTRDQAAEMLSLAGRTAGEIARLLREEGEKDQPNPIRALVKGTTRTLELDHGDVNRLLATSLTDFLVMGTVHRKGGPEHGAPHGEETP